MEKLLSKSAILKEVNNSKFSEDAKLMKVKYDCEMDGFFQGYMEGILKFLPTTTEKEIRNKAISEFAERLKGRLVGMQMAELQGEDMCPCAETGEECPYMSQDIGCQYCAREMTIKDIDEIAEKNEVCEIRNDVSESIEIVNQLAEEYKPKTNFDMCCQSIVNMAQIIDIAKVGWTREQIIDWLQSEVE